MKVLRIYVAGEGDTLRKVSLKTDINIDELISLNPHIASPNLDITGVHIKLPDLYQSIRNKVKVVPCPDISTDYQEQWLPITSLEKMEQTEYDVLIVGTGAGGGAALWRLCEKWRKNGKRIGVLEAGDLLLPTNAMNIATVDHERLVKYFFSVAKSPPQFPSPQVTALGGRTLFWTAVTPRMHVSDIVEWPVTVKEMEFYYKIAEKVMNVTHTFTKGSSITQILLNRLQGNGFPESIDEPIAVNLEQTRFGVVNSNVFFSSITFLAQALNRSIDIAVKARAVQVLTDKNKVIGIKVISSDEKKSYYLKAKTVILSASTFETPRILLHSGIQGNAIGHYLINHSRLVGAGKVSRDEFPEILGRLRILIPGTEDRPYQVQIWGPGKYPWVHFNEQPLKEEWEVNFYGSGKVESQFDNKVILDPNKRDEYGVPEIQVNFTYSEQDEVVIQQMAEGIQKASLAMKAPLISKNGQSFVCLMPPGLEHHDMGTCRMGDDPFTSATNRYGQVHGVHGLYVADNSVIPSSGSANPTLTTVALAIRTADYIIHQLK
ncbi:MAG: GMC oxidoreductase [Bacillota bacterium]